MISRQTIIQWWVKWAAPLIIAIVCLFSIFLAFRQHAAFQTNVYDLGSYAQVVWNLSHGYGFTTSLGPTNYLTNHFSLLLLILAPFFSVWPDARVLMVAESIALTTSIIPAYLIVRARYPRLAPLLVLAFAFSPLLHQTVTAEFHGVMLATPFLAWAFYGVYTRRTWLLLSMLGLAVLAREDVGLYVASFGLFMLIFRKGQRLLGAAIMAFGALWVIVIINWVMPSLGTAYHHWIAFSSVGGESLSDMVRNALRDPVQLIASTVTPSKLKALVRLIAPLAGLPLLAFGYPLLWIPMTVLYLISNASSSGLLNSWRLAPFLPLLWGSIAVLIVRLRPRWAYVSMTALLIATFVGFLTLSPFPGGAKFNASLYQVNEHTRIGERIVASLPADVPLAAQNGVAAHLSTRSWVRLFPWYDRSELASIVVLDEKSDNSWPLKADKLRAALANMQMDPAYDTIQEQDGYYVFQLAQDAPQLTQPVSLTWPSTLSLTGFDLAQTQADAAFQPVSDSINGDSRLRVILHWTALEAMPGYLAVSVRLVAPDGRVVAQEDSWPGRGALPTPLWEMGRSIRDVHYLDLPAEGLPEQLDLRVIVYAADTLEPIAPANGHTLTTLSTGNQAP
jgi:uncharacterized membrane protein